MSSNTGVVAEAKQPLSLVEAVKDCKDIPSLRGVKFVYRDLLIEVTSVTHLGDKYSICCAASGIGKLSSVEVGVSKIEVPEGTLPQGALEQLADMEYNMAIITSPNYRVQSQK